MHVWIVWGAVALVACAARLIWWLRNTTPDRLKMDVLRYYPSDTGHALRAGVQHRATELLARRGCVWPTPEASWDLRRSLEMTPAVTSMFEQIDVMARRATRWNIRSIQRKLREFCSSVSRSSFRPGRGWDDGVDSAVDLAAAAHATQVVADFASTELGATTRNGVRSVVFRDLVGYRIERHDSTSGELHGVELVEFDPRRVDPNEMLSGLLTGDLHCV